MKAKKTLAVLLTLALLAGTVPSVMLTLTPQAQAYSDYTKAHSTEYYYASGTQFIYQLGLYYSSSSDADAEQHILDAGFTPFGADFNVNAGGKYIHAGYKSTTDPAQAVKALRIWHASNDPTSTSSFVGGGICTFYQVGSGEHNVTPAVMDGMVGLNKGNGGDNLELFATPDYDAGPAITSLSMAHDRAAAAAQAILLNFGYTIATSFQNINIAQDLNAGAGSGTDYNYIGYKSACTAVDSDALRAAYQAAKACNGRGTASTALTNALNAASTILSDLNDGYTTRTQAQIDAAANSLTAALPESIHVYADYPAPTGTEYYYPAGTQFISQLVLTASDAANSTAVQDLQRMGFTPFGKSFNDGATGSDVRGGYKTTTDPAQAIKALRIWKNGSAPDVAASPINDTYAYFYQVGSGASAMTPGTFGRVNLNQGNSGDDLRLYVSTDHAAGLPITEFSMANYVNMLTQYSYTVVNSFHSPDTNQSLNDGAGGNYLFLGYRSTGLTAVDSSGLRAAYAEVKQNYERLGYTWICAALDPAAVILDDLRDGYTTYTQAQIDAAANALSSVPAEHVVRLDADSGVAPQIHKFEGAEIFLSSNNNAIAASREEAQPLQFYYESDGVLGFYLPNNYFPGTFSVSDGFEFDGWMLQSDSSDNPEYVTLTHAETVFIAKAKLKNLPVQAPRVPETITLAFDETQTTFDFIVDSCSGMIYDPDDGGAWLFGETNFKASLFDGVLTNGADGATLP